MTATYITKDQIPQHEQTNYWFDLNGESYAVAESRFESKILDSDGCPVNTNDAKNAHLVDVLVVTDDIRAL